MLRGWRNAALVVAIGSVELRAGVAWCQQAAQPPASGASVTDAKPAPAKAGSYWLVVTTLTPTATIHWLNPPPSIDAKAGTKLAPAETTGNLAIPPQYLIEAFGVPRYECDEAAQQQASPQSVAPQQHGCDALDHVDITIRDANTVAYRVASHGSAVHLRVNLQVHDLLPVSHIGSTSDWRSGDVIFVSVPKATPEFRFVSETLVGQWNGDAIVFEPGKPLPASAKKSLDDLGVHQDLGDSVLYSYKVK